MSHLKVVELADLVAAPYCGKLLADFGADVIKVEPPQHGDEARRRGPFPDDAPDPERSGLFLYLNTNKRGVTLDLGSEQGRELFRRLVADADVLIEDRTPGELARLGLDFQALRKINPRLIVTSVTPFGQTGPWAGYKSRHLTTFHASGQGYLLPMNSPDLTREPVRGAGYLGEYDAGVTAAIGTLGAVFKRGRGGPGQHIDVSKQHAVMHLEKSQLRRYVDDGVAPDRTGMGRLLETLVTGKDGRYVLIILSSQIQWKGLYKAMGEPEWAARPPFDTQAGRSANYPELRRRLQAWADGHTAEEIFHKIQACKSASAPVYDAEAFLQSPQLAARDYLVEYEHPAAGRLTHPGRPYKFSNVSWQGERPAPLLGQHNDEVFGRHLGCSQDDLAKFREAGVI
ncbi:CaiB/BaiF CoA transferase family protein [Streptomyces hyderabadensis]|uniref:CaiB/BaiF CoA-transferase family protein n=1 Tax=Streptomyces hyderabadensis TaxID=598549 RepID=A0ABP9IPN5_9ACTN|nr:CoA transferase [Streptomyces hyderabadensis]